MLDRRKGIAEALLAASLFGVSAPLAKQMLSDVSPQLLAGILYLGAGMGLGGVWLFRFGSSMRSEAGLTRRDIPVLATAITVGGVCGPLLLMVGLQRTPASSASLLLNFETVFTALLAWIVFRESANIRVVLGMISIVCGGLILSFTGTAQVNGWFGPLSITLACLCWGIDNNVTQKISANDPVQIAAIKGIIAGSVNSGLATLLGTEWPSFHTVAVGLLLGSVSYGASLALYIHALRYLGTSRAGNYFSLAPFMGAIVSLLFWRESLTISLLSASVFMAAGLWFHLTEHHAHWHTHEAMDHEHMHVHDAHHQHQHDLKDPAGEPHSHPHHHETLQHDHEHFPDIHHRHRH